MESYEQWTRSEIARLRLEADKAIAEAATLQRTLDKWLESQGQHAEHPVLSDSNGKRPPSEVTSIRHKKPAHGNKNATAIDMLKAAAPNGLTTDELYQEFSGIFGPKYKRSSLRALLWNQKKRGKIDLQNGRYIIPTVPLNG